MEMSVSVRDRRFLAMASIILTVPKSFLSWNYSKVILLMIFVAYHILFPQLMFPASSLLTIK